MSDTPLLEDFAGPDPVALFARWYADAESGGLVEPAAMALATAAPTGEPSVRMVLLRGVDRGGFVFFTNYLSRKGEELAGNPRAALAFYWAELGRQVRIEGTVTKVSAQESDVYFGSRPRGHQLGALVSGQSQVIAGRRVLEERLEELTREFDDREVPRPDNWGGYRVQAGSIEFWQSRDNRLHDRLLYTLAADGSWRRDRLSP